MKLIRFVCGSDVFYIFLLKDGHKCGECFISSLPARYGIFPNFFINEIMRNSSHNSRLRIKGKPNKQINKFNYIVCDVWLSQYQTLKPNNLTTIAISRFYL